MRKKYTIPLIRVKRRNTVNLLLENTIDSFGALIAGACPGGCGAPSTCGNPEQNAYCCGSVCCC